MLNRLSERFSDWLFRPKHDLVHFGKGFVVSRLRDESHDIPKFWKTRLFPHLALAAIVGVILKTIWARGWIEGKNGFIARHQDFYKQMYAADASLTQTPQDVVLRGYPVRYLSVLERQRHEAGWTPAADEEEFGTWTPLKA